jgi:protein SCO1/2
MQRRLLFAAIALSSALLVWVLWIWEPLPSTSSAPSHASLGLAATPTGGDFSLTSAAGPVNLKDLRGQVVLLYFGYTSCPDICPTNLAFVANALKQLAPEEQARVQVLFASLDPGRDDPQRLAQYTSYFHPRVLGVTGTPERIAQIARLYGAAYRRVEQPGSALGYLVDHSAYTYVIDREGRLVETLDHATPSERIVSVIRGLLAGG